MVIKAMANQFSSLGRTDNVVSFISVHHNYFQNLNQGGPSADNVK